MRRYFSALVLALLAATALAVPAQAHAELKSSNPASGAALDAPPKFIELVFSDTISLPDGDAVTVTGPDGAKWPMTQVHAQDKTITASVGEVAMHAGEHKLAWQARSDDGDTISGTFTFTVKLAGQTSSSAAPTSSVTMSAPVTNAPPSTTPSDSGGVPAWLWIVVILIVLVGVLLLVRRRKA